MEEHVKKMAQSALHAHALLDSPDSLVKHV